MIYVCQCHGVCLPGSIAICFTPSVLWFDNVPVKAVVILIVVGCYCFLFVAVFFIFVIVLLFSS